MKTWFQFSYTADKFEHSRLVCFQSIIMFTLSLSLSLGVPNSLFIQDSMIRGQRPVRCLHRRHVSDVCVGGGFTYSIL